MIHLLAKDAILKINQVVEVIVIQVVVVLHLLHQHQVLRVIVSVVHKVMQVRVGLLFQIVVVNVS